MVKCHWLKRAFNSKYIDLLVIGLSSGSAYIIF